MIVPNKITFYCQADTKADDGIYQTFPVDSAADHATAKSWATPRKHELRNGKTVYTPGSPPVVFEFDNAGFDNVTVVGIEYRNQGLVFKVTIEEGQEKFRLDLREDALMSVIKNVGILPGGRLNGTYCFAKNASQINLILEGTSEHAKAVLENEKRLKFTKTIKKSDLKPGYLYETITGEQSIFIGHVYTADTINHQLQKPHKSMLWAKMNRYNKEEFDKLKDPNALLEEFERLEYYIDIRKAHNFRIEVNQAITEDELITCFTNIKQLGLYKYNEVMAKEWTRYSNFDRSATNFYQMATLTTERDLLGMKQEDADEIKNKKSFT